jgi:hypothetical protein
VESRARGGASVLVAGCLIVYALTQKPGGYTFGRGAGRDRHRLRALFN